MTNPGGVISTDGEDGLDSAHTQWRKKESLASFHSLFSALSYIKWNLLYHILFLNGAMGSYLGSEHKLQVFGRALETCFSANHRGQ